MFSLTENTPKIPLIRSSPVPVHCRQSCTTGTLNNITYSLKDFYVPLHRPKIVGEERETETSLVPSAAGWYRRWIGMVIFAFIVPNLHGNGNIIRIYSVLHTKMEKKFFQTFKIVWIHLATVFHPIYTILEFCQKLLCRTSYLQLSSPCLEIRLNTVSHVWLMNNFMVAKWL